MRFSIILMALMLMCQGLSAQDRKVQNRPYTDLRPFHFGIVVGTHLQDMEFKNVGPVTVTDDEGNTSTSFITCDQDRVDPGFNVGVLGEFRLTENLQLRIAPEVYFGSRHIVFHNISDPDADEKRQDLKSAYITAACDLIFSAPRCNNHRAYMFAGIVPTQNLTTKSTDYLKLKSFQNYLEIGFGFDQYLPYFKLRPEVKFMFGLGNDNALDMNHYKQIRDKSMLPCTYSVSEAHTKMFTLSFYFE